MTTLSTTFDTLDRLEVDAIAIGLVCGDFPFSRALSLLDWRMCGLISHYLKRGDISGIQRELVLMPSLGRLPAKRFFFFGLGEERYMSGIIDDELSWIVSSLGMALVESCAFILPDHSPELSTTVENFLNAAALPFKNKGLFGGNQRPSTPTKGL